MFHDSVIERFISVRVQVASKVEEMLALLSKLSLVRLKRIKVEKGIQQLNY